MLEVQDVYSSTDTGKMHEEIVPGTMYRTLSYHSRRNIRGRGAGASQEATVSKIPHCIAVIFSFTASTCRPLTEKERLTSGLLGHSRAPRLEAVDFGPKKGRGVVAMERISLRGVDKE